MGANLSYLLLNSSLRYHRFQIVCVFPECDLFKPTKYIQHLVSVDFCIKGMVELVHLMWGGGLPSFLVQIFQYFGCTPN